MRLSFFVFLMTCICGGAASGQTTNLIPVESSYAAVESEHYIYLGEGNVWEYEVEHSENGIDASPTFIRYTVEEFRDINTSVNDYIVRVDFYDDFRKIRQVRCLARLERLRVTIGSNVATFSDCNYQSPFSQQDVTIDESGTTIQIGDQSYTASSVGAYQHFWGDQNGDNGYITFNYAPNIGLYYFESRTSSSPFNPKSKDAEWRSRLIYAWVNGQAYGTSEIQKRFGVSNIDPRLTPEQ